jgi:hypothetical protein
MSAMGAMRAAPRMPKRRGVVVLDINAGIRTATGHPPQRL